jgi:hypothetical protein
LHLHIYFGNGRITVTKQEENMHTVRLDISYEAPHDKVVKWANRHHCKTALIIEDGPAGGNPLYEFSSDDERHVKALIKDFQR